MYTRYTMNGDQFKKIQGITYGNTLETAHDGGPIMWEYSITFAVEDDDSHTLVSAFADGKCLVPTEHALWISMLANQSGITW